MRTLLIALAALLGAAGPPEPLRFTSFGVGSGLSQSSVYALAQDARGFLWVGTHDGLDRFDGYGFVAHRAGQGGLHDNRIQAIVAEGRHRLWVLSHGGLQLRDAREGKVHQVLRHRVSAGLAPRQAGGVWVGVRDTVVAAEQEGVQFVTRVPGTVKVLHEDREGRLWIGTNDGLYALVRGRLHGPWGRGKPIKAIVEPEPSTLWVGTADGTFRLRRDGTTERLPLQGEVRAFALGGDGVWAATAGEGRLFRLDRSGRTVREYATPLRGRHFTSLLLDRSGLLWIGTDGGGLFRVETKPLPAKPLLTGPPLSEANFIRTLAQSPEGRIWIGSLGGLHVLDAGGQLTTYRAGTRGLPDDEVRAAYVDTGGRLWIGTRKGAAVFGDGRFVPAPIPWRPPGPQPTQAFGEDASGGLWVGTRHGLYYRPLGAESFRDESARLRNSLDVRVLHLDATGRLWAVVNCGGLARLDVPRRPIFPPGMEAAPSCDVIGYALADDGAGALWMATSEGLYHFDPETERFTPHLLPAPSRRPYLYSLLRDAAGRLWLGTNSGLIRYDPATGTARRFTRADGLPDDELNAGAALRLRDGGLLFGTVGGLARFGPDHLDVPDAGPAVVFTAFTRFDEPVTDGPDVNLHNSLLLRPGETVFSLRFSALDFADATRLRYRYRIEGVDSSWVEAGESREARYTNLSAGTHRFLVQAAGVEGVWGPVRPLTIVVVPPFWKRPWFVGGVVLVLLGSLGWGARFVVTRRLRRQLRALETEQRVARELEMERARIAADVHDQVGATLTQIQLLSEIARTRPPEADHHTLQQVGLAVREAVRDLDAIVWALDPAHDGLERFADYLCAQAEEFCDRADLALRLEMPEGWPSGSLPAPVRHPVLLAVREAICNAVRHAGAREIRLRFSADDRAIAIEVEDDGRGFDPATKERFGHGLDNMRRRVRNVGGVCRITSVPGAGTRVRFELGLGESKTAYLGDGALGGNGRL